MNLVLYYAPNTCALAPYVTLTEANAAFEGRALNFRTGQNRSPEYLKLNPKHKVPLLIVDGEPLTENVAIQLWINRTFPQARVLPVEQWQELKAISILAWCSSGIHPFLSRINSPPRVCDLPGADDSVVRLAKELLDENYRFGEDMLAGREFFFDHFTAADAHFFWCLRRGIQLGADLAGFPTCAAFFERIKDRTSVQKLLEYEKAVQAEFAKAAEGAALRSGGGRARVEAGFLPPPAAGGVGVINRAPESSWPGQPGHDGLKGFPPTPRGPAKWRRNSARPSRDGPCLTLTGGGRHHHGERHARPGRRRLGQQ